MLLVTRENLTQERTIFMNRMIKVMFALVFALPLLSAVSAHAQGQPGTIYSSVGGASGCDLILNGTDVGGCVTYVTHPYRFAGDVQIFAVGRDTFPYYYSMNAHRFIMITNRTQIQHINEAYVDQFGEVQLQVIGTGGSTYTVPTGIFVGHAE